MSSNAQLLEEWNNRLSFKIKESDLLRPTELFVIHALGALLRELGIKDNITSRMISEDKNAARIAKMKFCTLIDRLYKVAFADSNTSFLYIDLVQPLAKKTTHIMRILLNYVFYQHFVKESVMEPIVPQIQRHAELFQQRNELKVEIERRRERSQNVERLVVERREELPGLKRERDALEAGEKALSGEVERLSHELKNVELVSGAARKRLVELQTKTVSDVEAENLMLSKAKLEAEMEQQEEFEAAAKEQHLENSAAIEGLKRCLERIESLMETYKLEHPAIGLKKELDGLERQLEELTRINGMDRGALEERLKETESGIKSKEAQKRSKSKKLKKELKKFKSQKTKLLRTLETLQEKDKNFGKEIKEIKLEIQEVIEHGSKFLYLFQYDEFPPSQP